MAVMAKGCPYPVDEIVLATPPPPKECPSCRRSLPVTANHWIFENGEATGICLDCLKSMPQRGDLERKTALLNDATARLMEAAKDGSLRAVHIVEIYSNLVQEMGGPQVLTSMWAEDIKKRRDQLDAAGKPPDRTLFDQYMAIFKMGAAVSDQALKAAAQLSDDELRRELLALMSEQLSDELVLTAEPVQC